MRTILSLCLSLFIFSSAQAASIREAMDDLNFALTVDWDQKDPRVFAEAVDAFEAAVTELRTQGVTEEAMIAELLPLIKDQRAIRELTRGEKASPQELVQLIRATSVKGASWNGDAIKGISLILGITIVWWGGLYLINTQFCDWCIST